MGDYVEDSLSINISKSYSVYAMHTAILSLSLAIISIVFYYSIYPNPILILAGSIFIIIFLAFLFLIGLIQRSTIHALSTTINQQFPSDLDYINTPHDAFVIVHSMNVSTPHSEAAGISNLIHDFKSRGYPFKIYHCYNPQGFDNILRNENALYIWIFGHGWHGGIAFKWKKNLIECFSRKKKETVLQYEDIIQNISDYPKKQFIAQLHCNHTSKKTLANRSLPDILLIEGATDRDYFVTGSSRNVYSNWWDTRKLAKSVTRVSLSDTSRQRGYHISSNAD